MRTAIALLTLLFVACGEAPDPSATKVVPIEPAAATAPADAHLSGTAAQEAPARWVCPMCDGVESDQPGDCPKCGMPLVKPEDAADVDAEAYHAGHDHAGHDHGAATTP
jgi:hypothetical protein